MLFTEQELQMSINPFSILDEAVYLAEQEATIYPSMVPIVENNRLQAYVVDFNGIRQLSESSGLNYLDSIVLVSEEEGIDPSEVCVAIDEADLIESPELANLGPIVVRPLSELDDEFQLCLEAVNAFMETEDEEFLDLLSEEVDRDGYEEAWKTARKMRLDHGDRKSGSKHGYKVSAAFYRLLSYLKKKHGLPVDNYDKKSYKFYLDMYKKAKEDEERERQEFEAFKAAMKKRSGSGGGSNGSGNVPPPKSGSGGSLVPKSGSGGFNGGGNGSHSKSGSGGSLVPKSGSGGGSNGSGNVPPPKSGSGGSLVPKSGSGGGSNGSGNVPPPKSGSGGSLVPKSGSGGFNGGGNGSHSKSGSGGSLVPKSGSGGFNGGGNGSHSKSGSGGSLVPKSGSGGMSFGKKAAIGAGIAAAIGGGVLAYQHYKNKPKSVIAKRIAALRSIYQKFLRNAQANPEKAGIFKRMAAKILGVIDKLMSFLQRKADGR